MRFMDESDDADDEDDVCDENRNQYRLRKKVRSRGEDYDFYKNLNFNENRHGEEIHFYRNHRGENANFDASRHGDEIHSFENHHGEEVNFDGRHQGKDVNFNANRNPVISEKANDRVQRLEKEIAQPTCIYRTPRLSHKSIKTQSRDSHHARRNQRFVAKALHTKNYQCNESWINM